MRELCDWCGKWVMRWVGRRETFRVVACERILVGEVIKAKCFDCIHTEKKCNWLQNNS